MLPIAVSMPGEEKKKRKKNNGAKKNKNNGIRCGVGLGRAVLMGDQIAVLYNESRRKVEEVSLKYESTLP